MSESTSEEEQKKFNKELLKKTNSKAPNYSAKAYELEGNSNQKNDWK